MKKIIGVGITCCLFGGVMSSQAADSFSQLQSEALAQVFDLGIDTAYASDSASLEKELPVLATDIQSWNKRYTGYVPRSGLSMNCGLIGINAKAHHIAYTLIFQTARVVWVPLKGKATHQSFWQVVHPKQEEYLWTYDLSEK